MGRDGSAVVVAALRDERPAVVGTRVNQVELVAAHRAHLDLPEAALSVEVDTERVAVAERPDLGLHGALAGKRVARVGGAVVVEPDDLAEVAGHGLGRSHLVDLARRDPQGAVHPHLGAEEQPACELEPARGPLRVAPDDLEATERAGVAAQGELGPGDCATGPARAALGVADVHDAVLGVLWVQGDVVETALTTVSDAGHTADCTRRLGDRVNDTEVASSLCDEDAVVGQEGDRPWFLMGGDDGRLEGLLASVQLLRRRWDGKSARRQCKSRRERNS